MLHKRNINSEKLDRLSVNQAIIDRINAKLYLEIGVKYGATLLKIKAKRRIGIDPKPAYRKVKKAIDNNQIEYFQVTSDDFFENYSNILSNTKIDVAFVDGLHEYKQVIKDIENCLKNLSEFGVIIAHDCNPQCEFQATPYNELAKKYLDKNGKCVENTGPWSGDVWKAIVYLRSRRKDINIIVLNCDWGLGIITKGDNLNPLNFTKKDIERMSYKDLENRREDFLNLTESRHFKVILKKLNRSSWFKRYLKEMF